VDRRAKVELYEQIRREYEHGGGTIRGIAKKMGIHRRLVREAVLSAEPVKRKTPERERPKLEQVMTFIDAILETDRTASRKQRHTAHRVWMRDSRRTSADRGGGVHDTSLCSGAQDRVEPHEARDVHSAVLCLGARSAGGLVRSLRGYRGRAREGIRILHAQHGQWRGIPLRVPALCGGVLALFLRGMHAEGGAAFGFCFVSALAIVQACMVANGNGEARRLNSNVRNACFRGTQAKFRDVLLIGLCAFVMVLPTALMGASSGAPAQFATVLSGGLVFSTADSWVV